MLTLTKRFTGFCGCAVFSTCLLNAADWPQYRGPDGDEISKETGLLKEWPAGGPAISWKATGVGSGFSGVSVAKGRVYTMGDGTDSSFVYVLNEADGKPVWSHKIGAIGGGNGFPGPRCTPTVDGGLVFAMGQFGDLACMDAGTGRELWRTNLEKDLGGKMMSGWGFSESPLPVGDKVIVTPGGPGGTVAALDKKTGRVIWRTKEVTDKASYSSAVLATIGKTRQVIQLTDSSVIGIEPASGKVLWRGARPGKTAVASSPVIAGDLVFVSSSYGIGCNCFQVTEPKDATGAWTVQQLYANTQMANQHGGMIGLGENVFGFSDIGKAWVWLNIKTGAVTQAENSKLHKGSETLADGMLYLRMEDKPGTVVLLEPSAMGWSEKGRFDQPDHSDRKSWPHPVVANGRLYLRDQDLLLAYDIKAK